MFPAVPSPPVLTRKEKIKILDIAARYAGNDKSLESALEIVLKLLKDDSVWAV